MFYIFLLLIGEEMKHQIVLQHIKLYLNVQKKMMVHYLLLVLLANMILINILTVEREKEKNYIN